MTSIVHPWQQGPTELIKYAINHMNTECNDRDFKNRIAFLLLDIGIETLFKVYLSLPDEVTNTKVPYQDRCKAVKGGFHGLVSCVKRAPRMICKI